MTPQTAWSLPPRSAVCTSCGTPFEPGMMTRTVLSEDHDRYIRQDLCSKCSENLSVSNPLSAWKTCIPERNIEKKPRLAASIIEQALRRCLDASDPCLPSNPAVAFFLAIMLERKRILIEQKQQNAQLHIYEHRDTKELFMLPSPPAMNAHELAAIEQNIQSVIEHMADS